MRMRVKVTKVGRHTIVKPACVNAARACELVKRSHLTHEEIKLFSLMGFDIQIVAK